MTKPCVGCNKAVVVKDLRDGTTQTFHNSAAADPYLRTLPAGAWRMWREVDGEPAGSGGCC